MVQRKVVDKLGIQANYSSHEHIKVRKPSSSQNQDGKNRLPDLKKKMMKKSRSSKLSDIGHQSLKSSTSSALRKNNISQPGKPPPTPDVPATSPTILFTPKKQTPVTKTVESSPNYMKSTTCSDARKEPQSSTQVSLRRNSTNSRVVSSFSSNNKKTTKTSSSKLVRTLIKTPSFKLSRPASSMKSSRVALCASDHLRPTCSSTLKDSKFPSYLTLNHGGTQSEGTSVMKVCPYTYCSLNGHRHHNASLPPLKRFLSARRRSFKNQKSAKLAVSSEKGIKEIGQEDAAERVGVDFFVEVYAIKTKEEVGKTTDVVSSIGGDEAECFIEAQVAESLSEGSPRFEIDTDESLERCSEEEEEEEEEDAEGDYVPLSDEEESEGRFSSRSTSQATDMEWEEGKFSEAETEDEADYSGEMNDESESVLWCLPDDSVESYNVDVTEYYEFLKEEFKEENECFEGDFAEEKNITELNLEIEESVQVSDGLMLDQLSSTEDKFEDLSGNEENIGLDEETESMQAFMDETSTEEQVQVQIEERRWRNTVSDAVDVTNEDPSSVASEDENQKTDESPETDKQVSDSDLTVVSGDILEEAERIADCVTLNPIEKKRVMICDDYVDQTDVKLDTSEMQEDNKGETEVRDAESKTKSENKPALSRVEQTSNDQELHKKWNRSMRGIKDLEEESTRDFNPREPNYLPLAAEPEPEKVDLKHQMMDERKNSDEWMSDYALQQTVTKLAPARKKKVALLVEAFEAVMPVTKSESHRLSRQHHHHHHHSQAFPHAVRPIQACS